MTKKNLNRRRILIGTVGGIAALAGCSGVTDEETVGADEGQSTDECECAEDPGSNGIFLNRYDAFGNQQSSDPPYVEGEVQNMSDHTKETVEVRVRAYDRSGEHLGSYFGNMSGLHPNAKWEFRIEVYEDPEEFVSYDVSATDQSFSRPDENSSDNG